MVHCNGCNTNFSLSGYTHHLAQSTNPACAQIYADFLAYQPDSSDEDGIDEGSPVQFAGDFFGTYEDSDFPMEDNPSPDAGPVDDEHGQGTIGNAADSDEVEGDDEDEDEDIDNEENYEAGWEPEPPLPGDGLDLPQEEEDDSAGMENDKRPEPRERADAERRIGGGTIITDYPDPLAGKPLRTDDTVYSNYKKDIENAEDNIYAPFTSKREWEIARWAKLRGPGSTALSDLLKIDGVSCTSVPHITQYSP